MSGEYRHRTDQLISGPPSTASTIHLNEFPNVLERREVIPGGISVEGIERLAATYGRDSPQFVARVLAQFPAQGEDSLIESRFVDAAAHRFESEEFEEADRHEPFVLGLDPAGPGEDSSVLCVRQGRIVRRFHAWRRLEAPELAEKVEEVCRSLMGAQMSCGTFGGPGVATVFVDAIGLGHGVAGILKRRLPALRYWVVPPDNPRHQLIRRTVDVAGVNISRAPREPGRFVRRKDELTWKLREELVEGRLAIARTEKRLIEELLAARMLATASGQMTCEPKSALRLRIGRSPDHLDALYLTFHGDVKDVKRRMVAVAAR